MSMWLVVKTGEGWLVLPLKDAKKGIPTADVDMGRAGFLEFSSWSPEWAMGGFFYKHFGPDPKHLASLQEQEARKAEEAAKEAEKLLTNPPPDEAES